jgi:uncharacterized protein (DUF1778 family)
MYKWSMKTQILQLRLQAAEKETFQKAADLAGVALSSWVRERLRRIARQELITAGQQIPFLQEKVERDG